MPAHNHALFASPNAATSPKPSGNGLGSTQSIHIYSAMRPTTAMNASSVGEAGGGQPFGIMEPYLTINYCIAAQGVYPSRN
ncbi:MAG TPA: hypothetical protein VEF34_00515 [Syntrophobacteraceae bacterium]|nr:hypothetical protein [Syntrophobacteraceae bacterium]